MLTAPLILYPNIKCFDSNGALAAGYLLYTYEAGTSTLVTTYQDRLAAAANTNPIVLNSIGEAVIYVLEPIKLVFKTPAGATIWTRDYLGEITSQPIIGTVVGGTTDNNYVVTTTPALTELVDGTTLVFSPDKDNENTLEEQPDGRYVEFTGTGIDDLTVTGPYVGTTPDSVFTFQIDGTIEPAPDACTATLSGTAGVVTAGNHYVKITFVTALGETLPGTASGVVAADGTKKIDLTAIPTGSAQVTARNVYMTKAGGTTYYYVAQVADNTTETYSINTADASLTVVAPTSDTTNGGTFKWKKDGGSWTTGVTIVTEKTSLVEGLSYHFSTVSGHTLGDLWTVTVMTPATVNLSGLGALIVYKNVGGDIQALDGSDMKAGYPAQLLYTLTENAWVLTNPQAPVTDTSYLNAIRYRKYISTDYTLKNTDQGYILDFTGTNVLTLLPAAQFANRFLYIRASNGAVTINIDAGAPAAEKIYCVEHATGTTSYVLTTFGANTIQLQCDGVTWYVSTTAAVPVTSLAWYEPASGTSGTTVTGWTKLTLDTVEDATDMIVDLTASQLTLPPGSYLIEAVVPFYCSAYFFVSARLRLYDSTSTTYYYGLTCSATGYEAPGGGMYVGGTAFLSRKINLTVESVLYLEANATSTITCGQPYTALGVAEQYNLVKITRTA